MNLTTPNNSTIILKLTTSDRGPTPVTLNTYASPDSPSKFVETGTGVSVESITGDTDPLPPGTYDLTLRSGHGSEVGNDTATVTVEPRSTNGLTAYVTGDVAPDEFENATEIRTAIADGTLAPATTVNANDTVVYAVNATGLTGLAETANASLDRGADLDRLEGVSFGVAPTEDDGNDSTDDALGPTLNGSAVHLDRNGLYLVADGERAFGTETSPDPGRTFEAAFRVDDERLRRTAADDRHRVTTELTYGAEDSIDGATVNEAAVDSTDASTSDGSGPTASSGSSGGSGATGTGGSAGGSAATGGGGGPSGPVDVGNAAGAGGRTRPGQAANRSGPRPGVGISIAPGTSEIPPSAGPAELFGVGASERGADAAAAAGSGSADGVSNGDPGGTSDGVTPAEPTDPAASADSPEPSAADDGSADGADASDLGYEDAPIRSTVYDLPGFDAVASLAAVAGASLLARRRGRGP